MRIPVVFSVSLIAHVARNAIAQMQRHVGGSRGFSDSHRAFERRVNRITFCCARQVHHRLRNRQLPFGTPKAFLH